MRFMHKSRRSTADALPGLPLVLLGIQLGVLMLAGGASRPDALGQVVVRAVSWLVLIVAVMFGPRPTLGTAKLVLILLIAAAVLPLVQLVPLPPATWQALPGRALFAEAALASGQTQAWRPWAIVPDATLNAAASLIVPFVTLLLLLMLQEKSRLPGLVLGLITINMCVGLVQGSGIVISNVFVNDTPGAVAGTFANRNHFALFLALGCLLAPVWSILHEPPARWRPALALGLVLVFLLTIVVSGSRAGFALGLMGASLGLLISRRAMHAALGRYPRWVVPALIAAIVSVIALLLYLSFVADRAVSIDRLFAAEPGQDMRARGLPVVVAMIGHYFPLGTGLGSFRNLFQVHEPLALLKPTVFNHAHNDFLEIVLDAGLPGLLLLVAAIAWWAWASLRAWRGVGAEHLVLPRLGSGCLLLIMAASIVDYPARTPVMMALVVIAAVWLSGHSLARSRSALLRPELHL